MKAAAKTRTLKPVRRPPAARAVAVKGHAPAFREIIGLIHPPGSARLRIPSRAQLCVSPPGCKAGAFALIRV